MTLYRVSAWSDLYVPTYGRLRAGQEFEVPDADRRTAEDLEARGVIERVGDPPEADAAGEPELGLDEKLGPQRSARKRSSR